MEDVRWQHELKVERTGIGVLEDFDLDSTRPSDEHPTPIGWKVSSSVHGAWHIASVCPEANNKILITWRRLLIDCPDDVSNHLRWTPEIQVDAGTIN